jgi:hypothetical protein
MRFLLIRVPVTAAMLVCPLWGIQLAKDTQTFSPIVAGFTIGIALGISQAVRPLARGQRIAVLVGAVLAIAGQYALSLGFDTWSWPFIGIGAWTATRAALPDEEDPNWELFQRAIDNRSYKGVLALLDNGVSARTKNVAKHPMLLGAVVQDDLRIVTLLLERGADINEPDSFGVTPLTMAARKGLKGIAALLISRGADVDGKNGLFGAPLIVAIENRHVDVVELLLASDANVDARPADGRTALHVASYYGVKSIAESLLARGAKSDGRDKDGMTPLDYATKRGHVDVVALLQGSH